MSNLSTPKISETILVFGEPLIAQLGEHYGRSEFDACLRLIIAVWNAVSLDDVEKGDRWVRSLHEHASTGPPQMQSTLTELVERKRALFREDLRGVGEHWIRDERDAFVFGCDARDLVSRYGTTE